MRYLHGSRGFTLIEVLVTVGVFAVLATMTTVMMTSALQGAKKAAAVALVKNEGAYAMGVINQMLKYADSLVTCDGANNSVEFIPRPGQATARLACVISGTDGYIASGSARLTSPRVKVTSCSITCDTGDPATARQVNVSLILEKAGAVFAFQKATTRFETQGGLRNRE